MEGFLDFLAGAITLGYLVSGGFFLRFWSKTRDRLFLAFALAFTFLALNQVVSTALEAGDERTLIAYGLRVVGFLLILAAIIDKNRSAQ
jgi:hypothetical protein